MVESMHAHLTGWPRLESPEDVENFLTPQRYETKRQSFCTRLTGLCWKVWTVVTEPLALLAHAAQQRSCCSKEETRLKKASIKIRTRQCWSRFQALYSKASYGNKLIFSTINAIKLNDVVICDHQPISTDLVEKLFELDPVRVEEGPLNSPVGFCLGASLWLIKLILTLDQGIYGHLEMSQNGAAKQAALLQWVHSHVHLADINYEGWLDAHRVFKRTIGAIDDPEKRKQRIKEEMDIELEITRFQQLKLKIEQIYCFKPGDPEENLPAGIYLVRVPNHAGVYIKSSFLSGLLYDIETGLFYLDERDHWNSIFKHFKNYNAVPADEQYVHFIRIENG